MLVRSSGSVRVVLDLREHLMHRCLRFAIFFERALQSVIFSKVLSRWIVSLCFRQPFCASSFLVSDSKRFTIKSLLVTGILSSLPDVQTPIGVVLLIDMMIVLGEGNLLVLRSYAGCFKRNCVGCAVIVCIDLVLL